MRGQTSALPEGWDERKNNVAIFPSSEDEFTAIGDVWKNPLYVDQQDGIRKVIAALRGDPDVHVCVRLPEPGGDDRPIDGARAPRVARASRQRHRANEPGSTYALMKNASRVLTFGSTTASRPSIGRPSILGAISAFDQLGGTYNPTSHDDLVALLRRRESPAQAEGRGAHVWLLRARLRASLRHFQPAGLFAGTFRGES